MEKRLGKGLSALITETTGKVNEKVEKLRLTDIVPNPFQPRTKFNETEMDELVSSIREKGIIQPILVRPAGDGYELVAGERRFRAAQRLQYEEISAIVRSDIDDVSSLEISLIENIQRAELNGIEATRKIRSFSAKVPIIAQTAYVMAEEKEESMQAGCNQFVTKPLDRTVIMEIIDSYFTRES